MILLTFNIINHHRKFRKNELMSDDEILKITENNASSILRILENHHVLASFFIEISLVEKVKPLIKKIVSKGHEIALYNDNSEISEIETVKRNTEDFIEKIIRGIRQKDVTVSVNELKQMEFSYISNIENANILFPLKRLQRSTKIIEENGVSIIPESISPYSQIPYNDFVFQTVPLKFYQNMVNETLKNEDFILIYLNSWQFTDFKKYQFKIPFYRKYNAGRKIEDKLQNFLHWINSNELACARLKDFVL